MTESAATRARVLHWFVRGGVIKIPGREPVTIDVDPIAIGRDEGAQIVFADPEVSSFHCELRAVAEGIAIRDLGSTNGTFVGTLRIREATITEPTEIVVGSSRLLIEPSAKKRVDVGFSDRFGGLVGQSPRMRRVFSVLEKVAATPLSVLILGETGTGKEIVARSIHDSSTRKDGPFVVVDCGAIPGTLAESILFGHEKGAFTGAHERRKGALADAHGGTLFLDELGELPLELQPKLLRALAERQVKRVGGSTFEPIDVRVLAATRRDLGAEMNEGRFRSDLFFRIAQVRVELPSLRERVADIPLLVEAICQRVGVPQHTNTVVSWIEQRMGGYDWPGNVRELVNVASVAATLADTPGAIDDVLTLARDNDSVRGGNSTTLGAGTGASSALADDQSTFTESKRSAIASFERDYFSGLVKRCSGNVSEMARQAGMERHHVRAYLRKYKLEKS
jgi:DNA-binding NtrC family response regulator